MPTNIQTALLPHKHVRFAESLIGVAGLIRNRLDSPRTLDELWTMLETEAYEWPVRLSFTQLVLAVDLLFAIKQVHSAPDGRVSLVASEFSV